MANSSSSESAADLAKALEQFRKVIKPEMVNRLQSFGPATVYTPWVTLWLLVYQRLYANASLQSAVAELTEIVEAVSSNKRVRERTLSMNTGAYSRARSRLTVEVTDAVADHVLATFIASTGPSLVDRRVFLIDGTTLTLPSRARLREHFPPAANQHGTGTWPVCHLTLAHELASGAALRPEIGAMYGPDGVSELALAVRMLPRIPAKSLLMADRNFGVFYFAYAAVQAGHDVLTRLTKPRFGALKRKARAVGPGLWTVTWKPSAWDRRAHADLPADAAVSIWLHEFVGFSGQTLWIATTCSASTKEVADIYAKRWGIESDIGQLKKTLQCESMRGQSPDMIRKELAIAMVSYNLVVQIRRIAAERAKVPPRRLSFSSVWSLVTIILLQPHDWTEEQWQEKFEWVLRGAAQRKLPNRPGRSYPREVLPRRRKFPERKRKPAGPLPAEPPK